MRRKLPWLILPPALGLLLVFGPLATDANGPPAEPATATVTGSAIPEVPDLWQIASTLLGVLLLGGAAIMGLAKLRATTPVGRDQIITLRQSMRLSQRHAVHAIEFADDILLVGECDGSLRVLETGDAPTRVADDRDLASRTLPDEDGAVPRDLIPRPEQPAAATLSNFKTLLRRARVEQR